MKPWTAAELRLWGRVLKALPGSPRQKELKAKLDKMREEANENPPNTAPGGND